MGPEHLLAEVEFSCRLAGLANWLIKAERELWGLLDGPWAGLQGNNQRVVWGQQVCLHFSLQCSAEIACWRAWGLDNS